MRKLKVTASSHPPCLTKDPAPCVASSGNKVGAVSTMPGPPPPLALGIRECGRGTGVGTWRPGLDGPALQLAMWHVGWGAGWKSGPNEPGPGLGPQLGRAVLAPAEAGLRIQACLSSFPAFLWVADICPCISQLSPY